MNLILLLVLFSFGQLGRISLFNQQVNFYLYEIYLFGLIILWIIKYKAKPIKVVFEQFKSIFIFSIIALTSFSVNILRFNSFDNSIALLFLARLFFYFIFFFYLGFHLKKQSFQRKSLEKGLFIFSVITIITSVVQYFLYPNLRNLFYLGWDPHQYRIFGAFFDTAITASIFGILILYYLVREKYVQPIIFGILGLLTFSRGFYISIISTVSYFLLERKLYKILFGIIAFFIFGLMIIPKPGGEGVNLKRTFSIDARVRDYQEAFTVFKQNPLIGIGYNHIGAIKKSYTNLEISHSKYSYHSSFLNIAVTTGIIGFYFFIKSLFEIAATSKNAKYYLLFIGLVSLFDNVLLHPFILFLLLLLISYEASLSHTSQ